MTTKLRQWRWDDLPVYNGFTHIERVRGWQVIHWMIETKEMAAPRVCCITGSTQRVGYHSENYYGWDAFPLCQSIHFALHQRFKRPAAWQRIVDQYARSEKEWFSVLSPSAIDLASELRDTHGPGIANIFVRANVPVELWQADLEKPPAVVPPAG